MMTPIWRKAIWTLALAVLLLFLSGCEGSVTGRSSTPTSEPTPEPAPEPEPEPVPEQPLSFGNIGVRDRNYTIGKAVDEILPAASGGTGTLTYSLSGSPKLPPGLSFNADTRRLSGTPTEAGTYDMTYRVVDGSGGLGTSVRLDATVSWAQGACAADGTIYWTDSNNRTIERVGLNGAGREVVLTGHERRRPNAIAIYDDKMYWTDWGAGTISRANLDGSNEENLVSATGASWFGLAHGIAVIANREGRTDGPFGGRVYWTVRGRFFRSHLDGVNARVVLEGRHPWYIYPLEFAVYDGMFYWIERDTDDSYIYRAPVEGTIHNGRRVAAPPHLLARSDNAPQGIAVYDGKVYWTEHHAGSIERMNLDGSGREVVIAGTARRDLTGRALGEATFPLAIAVHEGKVYWSTDPDSPHVSTGTIECANLDGSDRKVLVSGLTHIAGIAILPN